MKFKVSPDAGIDTEIECDCGQKFVIYVPDVPYKCPKCSQLYLAEILVLRTRVENDTHIFKGKIEDEKA